MGESTIPDGFLRADGWQWLRIIDLNNWMASRWKCSAICGPNGTLSLSCTHIISSHILSHYGKVVIIFLHVLPTLWFNIQVSCSINADFFVSVLWVAFPLQPPCCLWEYQKEMQSACWSGIFPTHVPVFVAYPLSLVIPLSPIRARTARHKSSIDSITIFIANSRWKR